jgi:hypothetical protein
MLLPCVGLLSITLDEPCVGDDSFDLKDAYMNSTMNLESINCLNLFGNEDKLACVACFLVVLVM